MHEITFLHQNADKWKAFETRLRDPRTGHPDELADLFIQITNDLSYARTFYPETKTTAYLQELATEAHNKLYTNRKEDQNRFVRFWATEVPRAVAQSHMQIFIAFLIFMMAMGIGALSASKDALFVRLILGDAYVNMTEANIEQDDPMAVYKEMRQMEMFLAITFNNVRVSFMAFIAGLLASFGTGYILLSNGIMVGAFQYFFYENGLLGEALRVIYIHGTLELSAIVIAGGAGLVLGNGILFPGTYTRTASFIRSVRQGTRVVIGLVPVFIAAGFLEGFVTRYTEMHWALSMVIIGSSAAFIIWYFIIYPLRFKEGNP